MARNILARRPGEWVMTTDSACAGTTMGFVQLLDPADYGLIYSDAPTQQAMDQFEVWNSVAGTRDLLVREARADGIAVYSFCKVLP